MAPVRRYRALAGVASWWAPGLWLILIVAAAGIHGWTLAMMVTVVGAIVRSLDPSVVLELSTTGLSRGFTLAGSFVGMPVVLGWPSIETIATSWRAPGDFSILETVITGGHGERVVVTTRMGLPAYRRLVREIVAAAPGAQHIGLTRQLLAEWDDPNPAEIHAADPGLVLAVLILVAWGLLLPLIFNRY